ncbi:MAG TPA: phosphate signaling complex protein PhoU [Limnochordia bacterium]|mgnify:CR=1 FL=1|jgi:phosphate transport system protein|nr:phosphate signaling complex protein PhoU [Limnochordia bacterium]HPZ31873.1 phosphate signaling complex protein PhoU [Limnochordia bacterium]HQD71664.1 phosphate signaling complex protein PhoU [Limnochordia bacterium]
MRSHFDSQLEHLNNEMIIMGALIESAIASATKALIDQDKEQAQKTLSIEREIDQKEKEIQALCLRLLVQQQPVARDLRQISAALKMITDMERIGDQALDISEIAPHLADSPYIKKLEHISQMAHATGKMVTDAVDAFVRKDLKKAYSVIDADDFVDNLFVEVKNDLIALVLENADNGTQALDLLMVAKYFERIGDHATNIAEWVVFSITGVEREKQPK